MMRTTCLPRSDLTRRQPTDALSDLFSGYNLREYSPNVRRFFLFGIPLFAGMAIQSLLYNLYLTRLGYQEDFIGQMAGLAPIASGLLAIPTGIISDRIGRKPFLLAAAAIMATTQVGLCTVTNPAFLLALSFVSGTAGTFIWVNHVPFLSENARPQRRAQAIAIWISIQTVTRMALSLVAGSLPGLMGRLTDTGTDLPEPYRWALYVGAALCLVALLPLIGVHVKAPQDQAREQTGAAPFPLRTFVAFGAISICRGASMGFSFPFFNVFFQQAVGLSTPVIGLVFFLSQVVAVPCTVLAPALVRRLGAINTIVPTRIVGSLALVVLGFADNLPLGMACFLLAGLVEAITMPTEMTYTTQIIPSRYWARMQSLRVTGFQIPSGIASLAAGFLIVEYGYWATFALAGTTRLMSALILFFVFKDTKPEEAGD
ncbi:MAG: MFS transporter [Gemmatimonadetes bacterium]|nr:MFS transporter [Gemmatimonadota bacterium]